MKKREEREKELLQDELSLALQQLILQYNITGKIRAEITGLRNALLKLDKDPREYFETLDV